MGILLCSSNLPYLQEKEQKMGSLSTEVLHEDWSALHTLVEVSCYVSEQEKKGICVLSLLNHQQGNPKKPRSPHRVRTPKMKSPISDHIIASGSCDDQENTRIDDSNKVSKRKRKRCVDDECFNEREDLDAKKNKKKRRYMMRVEKGLYQPPPDLPEEYKKMANGAKEELVIQKQLFTSDVNPDLNRLTLPPKQILCKEFLRADEVERLQPKETFMKVPFIDAMLEEEEISVSLWKLSSSNEKSVVLNSKWNDIVKKNGLVEGDLIQIWSFRDRNDQLQLALVVVKRAEKCENHEEGRRSVSNAIERNSSEGQNGRKCIKIRVKFNARRCESISTSELMCL